MQTDVSLNLVPLFALLPAVIPSLDLWSISVLMAIVFTTLSIFTDCIYMHFCIGHYACGAQNMDFMILQYLFLGFKMFTISVDYALLVSEHENSLQFLQVAAAGAIMNFICSLLKHFR